MNRNQLHFHQVHVALVCAMIAWFMSVARADDAIPRSADGKILVQVKDATVAFAQEDLHDKRTSFFVATPPGTKPYHFDLTDLLADPTRYAPRLRSSEWSSASISRKASPPFEINGVSVPKGVFKVGIVSGVDKNCEQWSVEWTRLREAAVNMVADQFGWIRQDNPIRPPTSQFIKFLDNNDKRNGRYYGVSCGFAGFCTVQTCHAGLTAFITIISSKKVEGEDYSVKDFDRQIASGIEVLQRFVLNTSIDLSHP